MYFYIPDTRSAQTEGMEKDVQNERNKLKSKAFEQAEAVCVYAEGLFRS